MVGQYLCQTLFRGEKTIYCTPIVDKCEKAGDLEVVKVGVLGTAGETAEWSEKLLLSFYTKSTPLADEVSSVENRNCHLGTIQQSAGQYS